MQDVGAGRGKNYALNFPMRDGMDDVTYKGVFEPIIKRVFYVLYKLLKQNVFDFLDKK